jgi:hypothetical protein
LSDGLGNFRNDIFECIGIADPLGELGEDLVRRGFFPVNQSISQPLGADADGLEEKSDEGRDNDGQNEVGPTTRTERRSDPNNDSQVSQCDECSK